MASTSVQINFSKAGEDIEDLLFLELDTEANEEKITFTIDDKVYLRFLFANEDPYEIKVSMGTAKVEATNIHYPIEDEEIQFPNKNEGWLRYVPCSSVSYEWIGDAPYDTELHGTYLSHPSFLFGNCISSSSIG